MVYFLRDLACYRRFRLSKGYFRGRLGFHRESLRKSILPSQSSLGTHLSYEVFDRISVKQIPQPCGQFDKDLADIRDGTFRVALSLHPEEEVDNVWLLPVEKRAAVAYCS